MTKDPQDVLDDDPFADEESENQPDKNDESANPEPREGMPESSVPNSTSDPTDGEIGHVLASEEIHVTRGDYNVNTFVTTGQRDGVRIGDYVQIPYPDSGDELFSVIDGLRYEPYTELDDKSDTHNQISKSHELDESEFVLVAELEPIAILRQQSEGLARGIVNRIPKPNTPVSLSREDEYLRTGLNIPKRESSQGTSPSAATR